MKNLLALLLLATPVLAPAQTADPTRWVDYMPATTTLTGTIVLEPYGPDASPIDVGKKAWILRLDAPVSVKGVKDDDMSVEEKDVKEIQLSVDVSKTPIPKAGLGKTRFTVTGELMHAHTIHHVRDIFMLVSAVTAVKK